MADLLERAARSICKSVQSMYDPGEFISGGRRAWEEYVTDAKPVIDMTIDEAAEMVGKMMKKTDYKKLDSASVVAAILAMKGK